MQTRSIRGDSSATVAPAMESTSGAQEVLEQAPSPASSGEAHPAPPQTPEPVEDKRAAADHHLEVMVKVGEELAQSPELDLAEEVFSNLREIIPEHGYAYRALGEIDLKRGDLEKARVHLEKALAFSPDDARAHFLLGDVLFRSDDLDGAERELAAGLAATDPTHPLYSNARSQLALTRRLQKVVALSGLAGLAEARERLQRFRSDEAQAESTSSSSGDEPVAAGVATE